jgi:NAD-dependent deacetylase
MQELIKKAVDDLCRCRYAVALTGAGISTESGIPDFRGPTGVWTRDPEAERQAYRSYELFQDNPAAYWEDRLARSSPLGDLARAAPNPGHLALAELEQLGILKCIVTQNVDNLHQRAGSHNVLDYHGNNFRLRCSQCLARYELAEYNLSELRREGRLPPLCPRCGGIIKLDTVHFGEPIPEDIAALSVEEVRKCDLMLICGTSAVVYPFARLPVIVRQRRDEPVAVIIEINVEPTPLTREGISDYLIRGKTGEILPQIVAGIKQQERNS